MTRWLNELQFTRLQQGVFERLQAQEAAASTSSTHSSGTAENNGTLPQTTVAARNLKYKAAVYDEIVAVFGQRPTRASPSGVAGQSSSSSTVDVPAEQLPTSSQSLIASEDTARRLAELEAKEVEAERIARAKAVTEAKKRMDAEKSRQRRGMKKSALRAEGTGQEGSSQARTRFPVDHEFQRVLRESEMERVEANLIAKAKGEMGAGMNMSARIERDGASMGSAQLSKAAAEQEDSEWDKSSSEDSNILSDGSEYREGEEVAGTKTASRKYVTPKPTVPTTEYHEGEVAVGYQLTSQKYIARGPFVFHAKGTKPPKFSSEPEPMEVDTDVQEINRTSFNFTSPARSSANAAPIEDRETSLGVMIFPSAKRVGRPPGSKTKIQIPAWKLASISFPSSDSSEEEQESEGMNMASKKTDQASEQVPSNPVINSFTSEPSPVIQAPLSTAPFATGHKARVKHVSRRGPPAGYRPVLVPLSNVPASEHFGTPGAVVGPAPVLPVAQISPITSGLFTASAMVRIAAHAKKLADDKAKFEAEQKLKTGQNDAQAAMIERVVVTMKKNQTSSSASSHGVGPEPLGNEVAIGFSTSVQSPAPTTPTLPPTAAELEAERKQRQKSEKLSALAKRRWANGDLGREMQERKAAVRAENLRNLQDSISGSTAQVDTESPDNEVAMGFTPFTQPPPPTTPALPSTAVELEAERKKKQKSEKLSNSAKRKWANGEMQTAEEKRKAANEARRLKRAQAKAAASTVHAATEPLGDETPMASSLAPSPASIDPAPSQLEEPPKKKKRPKSAKQLANMAATKARRNKKILAMYATRAAALGKYLPGLSPSPEPQLPDPQEPSMAPPSSTAVASSTVIAASNGMAPSTAIAPPTGLALSAALTPPTIPTPSTPALITPPLTCTMADTSPSDLISLISPPSYTAGYYKFLCPLCPSSHSTSWYRPKTKKGHMRDCVAHFRRAHKEVLAEVKGQGEDGEKKVVIEYCGWLVLDGDRDWFRGRKEGGEGKKVVREGRGWVEVAEGGSGSGGSGEGSEGEK